MLRTPQILSGLSKYVRILNAFDIASPHGLLHIVSELLPIFPQLLCRVCGRCFLARTQSWQNMFLPLFNGSSAFGSKNKYCNPTITEFKLRTGFQSSLRIFRQTFPSRSTFG